MPQVNIVVQTDEIIRLTRIAYDKIAAKYHEDFNNEMQQKEYDRLLLDRFSAMLDVGSRICDAGCGPSAHIGKYLSDKGHRVTGIDISSRCIDIAKRNNPDMPCEVADIRNTGFGDNTFDAVISFYSIIYTPKMYVGEIFSEFRRILRPGGKLLVVVKKGTDEGLIDHEYYEGNSVHFTHFMENELEQFFSAAKFEIQFLDVRKPYDFEFNVDRIYGIASKR